MFDKSDPRATLTMANKKADSMSLLEQNMGSSMS